MLLTHLKLCTEENWLWNYQAKTNNYITIKPQNVTQQLYQLSLRQLENILSIKKLSTRKIRIVIAAVDPIQFLATLIAAITAQVDIFLANPNWQAKEWQEALNITKPDAIFRDRSIENLVEKEEIASNVVNIDKQSLIMIPTGGTSGTIKFAIHNWSTLTASVKGFQAYFDCDKINCFCSLPLYHVSGLMQFVRSFITQGKLIICPYSLIKNQQISPQYSECFISLVPTQLNQIIQQSPDWLKQFKTILIGGAPAERSLLNLAREYQLPVAISYGMTETASQIVTLKPNDFLAGNDSNGQVLPHAKIEIEPNNDFVAAQPIGLIKIESNSLFLGYYPNFNQAKQQFITDDLGYIDSAGYLYIIGRNSHKIITGGENVFPKEVEAVILATKLVKEVCIIGVENKYWGQTVTAIYVPLESNPDINIIKTQIKLQLAKYKQPKNWIKINKLPRNPQGKINYQKLQAIARANNR